VKTTVHIIDVGQGNMVLIEAANGAVLLYDCNVTDANEARVLGYLRYVLGRRRIRYFINSHRDADHMRGINKVHRAVGIDRIFDNGRPGGDIFTPEYEEYMRTRRQCRPGVLSENEYEDFGSTRVRILSVGSDDLPDDPNAQSVVLKVQHLTSQNSIVLTGDSDVATWRRIRQRHSDLELSSEILLASHHGSSSFFDVERDGYYYAAHIRAISPAMTLVSVGPNVHGHPDADAITYYQQHSRGSAAGEQVWRTETHGTMRLEFSAGPWRLWPWQIVPAPRPRIALPPPPPPSPFWPYSPTLRDVLTAPPLPPRAIDGPPLPPWLPELSGLPPVPPPPRPRAIDQAAALEFDPEFWQRILFGPGRR
jgi:beta-lactamase superfamily II metal-dependent hydrolase